jgi:peptide/nickel transport system substrate-binding protein
VALNRTVRSIVAISTMALAIGLTGCTSVENESELIVIGQKSGIQRLDPASVFSTEDQEPIFQAFGSLFNSLPGDLALKPDLAESGEFISPREYEVRLRPGLSFSNGNELTASDVKHSIERTINIDDPNGPQLLLQQLDEVVLVDELTLVFKLLNEFDQTFPYVLSSVAAVVVDEDVFPADRVLTASEIVDAGSFSGPYIIDSFDPDSLVSYKPNPAFQGIWGTPRNSGVLARYYSDNSNLALDMKTGQLDIAMARRALMPSAITDILKDTNIRLVTSEGSVPIFINFRLDTQPYGTSSPNPSEVRSRAIRQAVAHLVDRDEISRIAYGGSVSPSFSYIPKGLVGHSQVLKTLYGDGAGKPSAAKAEAVLRENGINEKVTLRLLYSPERYGGMTDVAVNQLKDQLEKDGLFELQLYTAEWGAFREIRVSESPEYDLFFVQWSPDFGDPDNYLSPLFGPDSWLATGFQSQRVNSLIRKQLSSPSPAERALVIGEIEQILSKELPAIVLGMDGRSALVHQGVQGIDDILDVSFKVRYGFITKN